jgi:hypothetical protein
LNWQSSGEKDKVLLHSMKGGKHKENTAVHNDIKKKNGNMCEIIPCQI